MKKVSLEQRVTDLENILMALTNKTHMEVYDLKKQVVEAKDIATRSIGMSVLSSLVLFAVFSVVIVTNFISK